MSKSTNSSETVVIFFYLLSMKCSTLLMSKSKVRIGVGIGISQLIIACCLACSAALWTVDLIQLWRYNSFLNENDPMGSGKSYIKMLIEHYYKSAKCTILGFAWLWHGSIALFLDLLEFLWLLYGFCLYDIDSDLGAFSNLYYRHQYGNVLVPISIW